MVGYLHTQRDTSGFTVDIKSTLQLKKIPIFLAIQYKINLKHNFAGKKIFLSNSRLYDGFKDGALEVSRKARGYQNYLQLSL